SVIFYNHYPRLWQAIKDPFAAAKTFPPRYMSLGVGRIGLLVLAILVGHFGMAYLLSLQRLKAQKLAVFILAAVFVFGLAWSLYHYPGLLDAGLNLALLLMIILISAFVGRKLLHMLGPKSDSALEEFVFSVGLGLGLFAYAILALAVLGLLHAWLVWLILVMLGIALFKDIWYSIKNLGKHLSRLFTAGFSVKNRAADVFLISLISIYLLVNLIGALAPEIEVDALTHHLYVPRVYIENHRLVYIPYHLPSAYPLGMQMLFTLGMLLSTSVLAKLIHFSLGVLSLLATYCFGRKYMDSRAGLLAATIFYTVSVVAWESTTAYIDLGFTFFTTLEIFALVNWWHSRREPFLKQWLAVAAIMCGFAMGIKYHGVFGLILLVIGILLKLRFAARGEISLALKTIFIYGSISILIVSPWLIRNYIFTGNPVFPFLNNIFKSPLMRPINPTFTRGSFGMGDNLFSRYILSPWNMTFHGEKYGGVISPIFLMFLPFLFVIRVDKVIKYMILFCGVYFALWETSASIMRYLIPIMPFLSIVVSHVINGLVSWDSMGNKVLSAGVITVTGTVLFLNLPFFHPFWQKEWSQGIVRHVPYQVVLGIESREHYLSRRIGSYDVFQYVNRNLPSDAKILCFNEEFRYLSDRTLVFHWSFEARNIASSRNAAELFRHIKDLEVTHFLINWGAVADTQRGFWILQDSFVKKHLDPLYRNRSVALYKFSFEALPPRNYIWREGEAFLSQAGSRTTDFKAPASKGLCLGMGWGTSKGDFVEYEVSIPQDLPSAVLFIRYAREGQTDAALNVYLDGQLVGTSPGVSLSPTGGWGYEADEWAYQELPLGPIEEGEHKAKFISRVDGGNVNIDGFFIADSSFQPPGDIRHVIFD
ncbi:MAG: phospholipid carrier-dependent glycosyltransferase, partial [bacterium]